MPTKAKAKSTKEKTYSFNEYRRAFCVEPEPESEPDFSTPDARTFGASVVRDALKKSKKETERKTS